MSRMGPKQCQMLIFKVDDLVQSPLMSRSILPLPNTATTGEFGYVFGYKSASDYWVQAYNLQDEQVGYYHVVDGQKGAMLSPQTWDVPADWVLRLGRVCG